MCNLLRRLHLFSGLILLCFVILYFATGFVMIHEGWFERGEPRKETRTEMLHNNGDLSTPEFMDFLKDEYGIRGKSQPPKRQKDGSWKFNFVRPGLNHEVTIKADGKEVSITRSEFDGVGIAHGLHRLHGYGGGKLYDAWAVVFDVASGSMILFSISGILLWFQTTKKRTTGWICLLISFAFSGAMITYFMLLP